MAELVPNDKIDLLYTVHGAGWSTCLVFVNQVPHEMVPTHIFGDPLEALLDGFARMLEGATASDILWHDEPGRFEWHIELHPAHPHLVTISISNCVALTGPKTGRTLAIEFSTGLEVFATILLYQAKKNRDLVKMKSYVERPDAFPHAALDAFERAQKRKYCR